MLYSNNCSTFVLWLVNHPLTPYGFGGSLAYCDKKGFIYVRCVLRACNVLIFYNTFNLYLKLLPLCSQCGKVALIMTNSVNETKQVKAIQLVSNEEVKAIISEIFKDIKNFGGLKQIMEDTDNFAYSFTDVKTVDNDTFAPIKVGKKSFYRSPNGKVNKANVLNVIKSVIKIEDAKRILSKKMAKRLTFDQFCESSDTKQRLNDMETSLKLIANMSMTDKQKKDTLHRLYDEYLNDLGL